MAVTVAQKVASHHFTAIKDIVVRVCGCCLKNINAGQEVYYFHLEEDDFCSDECLQERYKDDEEAHEMTASGYRP